MRLVLLSLLLSFSIQAKNKKLKLNTATTWNDVVSYYICTEESESFCKHFRLTKESAQRKIAILCQNPQRLTAIWRENRIREFWCVDEVTNSFCQSQGFDCAVKNECVIDGAIKSNAGALEDYQEAMDEITKDPEKSNNFT